MPLDALVVTFVGLNNEERTPFVILNGRTALDTVPAAEIVLLLEIVIRVPAVSISCFNAN